jgi:hypothetical protein
MKEAVPTAGHWLEISASLIAVRLRHHGDRFVPMAEG